MQHKGKKAYVYPPKSKNRYLELTRNAISLIGFEVEPLDKNFYRNELLSKRESYVVINWAEDFAYPPNSCSIFEHFVRFFKTIILIVFSKIFAKKVIWVRHNFKPHNAKGSRKRYNFILFLYKTLGITEVSLEDYYSTPSLTHPLYISNQEIQKKIDEINDTIQTYNPDYVFFDTPGQIELFAFRTSGPFFVQNINDQEKVNIFLCDSTLISKPENFVSIALLANSIKLQLKIPQICVLSKQDLIKDDNLLKWADDPTEIFNDLPEDGEIYNLTSRIARNLLESDLFDELIPVSSVNNQGIVEIIALLSRILDRGD